MSETNITLEHTQKLQIVVVVRYKPSDKGLAAASMVDSVASGIKSMSDAVDGALSYVPGVLQEQKKQEHPLDAGFIYHEMYPKHWDKVLKETEEAIKEMHPDNQYILYEYDSNDQLDLHTTILESKLKAAIAPLSQKYYGIHFVGLDQGGNIAVDVAQKIKGSLPEDGCIDSIFCVGTALHGDESKRNFLNTIPNVANYKSSFDLSANAILYAKEPEQLIDAIKLVNQTPIKYMYNMLVIKITKILTQLLSGLSMNSSTGLDPLKNLTESIKGDVKSIIEDILKFVKHIAGAFKEFLNMPDIDQKFDQVFGSVDSVASDSIDRLKQFAKTIGDLFVSGVKKGSLDLKDLPIEKLFNFLTPPVLLINNAFNAVTVDLNDSAQANKLKDFTEKDKFNNPITQFDKQMAAKDPYQQSVLESAKKQEPDQLMSMISTVKSGIVDLGNPDTSDSKRASIGVSISRSLMLPMLSSKTDLLAVLMEKLPSIGNNLAFNKIESNTLTAPLISVMKKLRENFDFDNTDNGNDKELGLKKALERLDGSIGKIKEIFKPNYFKKANQFNSLHFIYNSHNIAMAEMPKELRKNLDMATNIYATKLAKGFDYNELDGSYKPGKDGVKTEDILVVEPAKESA